MYSLRKDGLRNTLGGLDIRGSLRHVLGIGMHVLGPLVARDVGQTTAHAGVDAMNRIVGSSVGEAIDDGLVLLLDGILGSGPKAHGILLAEEARHGTAITLLEVALHLTGRGKLAAGINDAGGDVVPGLLIDDLMVNVPESIGVAEADGTTALGHVDALAEVLAEGQTLQAPASLDGVARVGREALGEAVDEGLEGSHVDGRGALPDANVEIAVGATAEGGEAFVATPEWENHCLVDGHILVAHKLDEVDDPFVLHVHMCVYVSVLRGKYKR